MRTLFSPFSRGRCGHIVAGLFVCLAAVSPVQAADEKKSDERGGVGEDCGTAIPIAGNPVIQGIAMASWTTGGPQFISCADVQIAGISQDSWYSYTLPISGDFIVESCGFGAVNTKIEVYLAGLCGETPLIACSDDACGQESRVFIGEQAAGSTFLIRFGGSPAGAPHFGFTGFAAYVVGANDSCATPNFIFGVGGFAFSTVGYSAGDSVPGCPMGNDAWFHWTSLADGQFNVNTCSLGEFGDTAIAVYADEGAGVCPTLPPLACNDNLCFQNASASFQAVAGNSYLIRIGDGFTAKQGLGESFTITAAGDDCITALQIAGNPVESVYVPSQFSDGGPSLAGCADPSPPGMLQDAWYRWTAPNDGDVTIRSCGPIGGGQDLKIEVWDGCGGARIACADNDGCGIPGWMSPSITLFGVTMGTEFTIRVGISPAFGKPGGGFTTFTVSQFSPPSNDSCGGAQFISGTGEFAFTNVMATNDDIAGDGRALTRDVWFLWNPPSAGRYVISTCGLPIDSRVVVYDFFAAGKECVSSLPAAEIGYGDDEICAPNSSIIINANEFSDYLIRIGETPGTGDAGGMGMFSIRPDTDYTIVRVDPDSPGGDGHTWDRALPTIQGAMDLYAALTAVESIPNFEVRIAEGTYREMLTESPHVIVTDFTLAGGFEGFGSGTPDTQSPSGTTISGDLLGNDIGLTNREDNLALLFRFDLRSNVTFTTSFIGFNNVGSMDRGASAVSVRTVSPDGSSSVNILFTRFENNLASSPGFSVLGGGLSVAQNPGRVNLNLLINNCNFSTNTVVGSGAGLFVAENIPVDISDTVFGGNVALDAGNGARGAGVCIFGPTASLTMNRCGMNGNYAQGPQGLGAAVYATDVGTITIKSCPMTSNSADGAGGVVYANAFSQYRAGNNYADGNVAPFGAGFYLRANTFAELQNMYFHDNRSQDGAAVYAAGIGGSGPFLRLENCTVVSNVCSAEAGSAVKHAVGGPIETDNSVYWGNSAAGSFAGAAQLAVTPPDLGGPRGAPPLIARWSTIQNHADAFCCIGISGEDPRIIPGVVRPGGDGAFGTDDDRISRRSYRILPGSPSVDSGDMFLLPSDTLDLDNDGNTFETLPIDLNSAARITDDPLTADAGFGTHIDRGAVERGLEGAALLGPSGTMSDPGAWTPAGVPTPGDIAVLRYDIAQDYFVTTSLTLGQLVSDEGVLNTINPFGPGPFVLTLAQPGDDTLMVGPWEGNPSTLRLRVPVVLPYGSVRVGSPGNTELSRLTVVESLDLDRGSLNLWSGELLLQGSGGIGGEVRFGPGPGRLNVNERSRIVTDTSGLIAGTVQNLGALVLRGESITARGVLQTPAELTINGTYSQVGTGSGGRSSAGSMSLRLFDPMAGPSDRLTINGDAFLGGTLNIALSNDYNPSLNATPARLIDVTGAINGRFNLINLPGLNDGKFLRAVYDEVRGGLVGIDIIVDSIPRLLTLQPPTEYDTPGEPRNAAVGDLNGDTFIDLAIAVPSANPMGGGDVIILLNRGVDIDGNWEEFDAAQTVQVPVGVNPVALNIADFNADGINDLVVLTEGDGMAQVILNTSLVRGVGTIPTFTLSDAVSVGVNPRDIATADFDGDQRPDIAVVSRTQDDDGALFVAINEGGEGGAWMGVGESMQTPVDGDPSSIDPADMDDDKDIDVIVGAIGAGRISIITNPGGRSGERGWTGFSGEAVVIAEDGDPSSIDPADMDDDKDIDVVVTDRAGAQVQIILNRGGLTFGAPTSTTVGANPRSVASADLDGDGDLDLAIVADSAVRGGREIFTFRNDLIGGLITLTPVTSPNTGADPLVVLRGNVDNDADDDLITVNETTGVARGPSTPESDVSVLLSTPSCLGDVNDDGLVDDDDVQMILDHWDQQVLPGTFGDANRDGVITIADMALVVLVWGTGC